MHKSAEASFLDELCDRRPSSRVMLREAWPALSFETQMTILFRITADPNYSENLELLDQALASPNAYIRHLAVRSGWLETRSLDAEAGKAKLRSRLAADPSALVQGGLVHRDAYSQLVGTGPDPNEVCALPQEARLTLLRRVKHPVDWFPKFARRAITHGLPPVEVRALVEEYLVTHVAQRFTGEGMEVWSERDAQRGLGELWKLAAQLLGHYADSAEMLINRLPARTQPISIECIPEDALDAMTDPALIALLRRGDVDLGTFRAAVLVRGDSPSDELLEAAASRSVAMNEMQFAVLLTLPERLAALEYCEGFSPVMVRALKDCYRFKYGHPRFGELTDYPDATIRHQLASLPAELQRETVKELRKYQLATVLSPWPNQPPSIDEAARSSELIDRGRPWTILVARLQRPKAMAVAGDPWATYCNFGRYFDIKENYEALRCFSSGQYPDDLPEKPPTA